LTHGRLQPDPADLPPGRRTTVPTGGPLGTAAVITLPPDR
jgi:hypothetical protein